MSTDLPHLAELARKATPDMDERPSISIAGEMRSMQRHLSALIEFHTAMSPDVALALIAELEAARAFVRTVENARIESTLDSSRDFTRAELMIFDALHAHDQAVQQRGEGKG